MGHFRSKSTSSILMAIVLLATIMFFYQGIPSTSSSTLRSPFSPIDAQRHTTMHSVTVVVDDDDRKHVDVVALNTDQDTEAELQESENRKWKQREKEDEAEQKQKAIETEEKQKAESQRVAAEEAEKKKKQTEEEKEKEKKKKKKEEEEKTHKVEISDFSVTTTTTHNSLHPSQIVILTASDGGGHNGAIPNILETTAQNRAAYAKRHGFQNIFLNISSFEIGGAHPVWAKLPAIAETFNKFPDAEWIWWLDLDALITTPKINLIDHILAPEAMQEKLLTNTKINKVSMKDKPEILTPARYDVSKINLLITQDHNGPNAGSFLIRRSEWTRNFMYMWADPFFVSQKWPGQEQDTIVHFLREQPNTREHIGLVEQNVINAYVWAGRGMLVTHFAGCWVKDECKDRWEETMKVLRETEAAELQELQGQAAEENKEEEQTTMQLG